MNKKLILLCAIIFGVIGGYVPQLLGSTSLLDGWSILTSTVGGLLGICVGVFISNRWG